MTVTSVSPRPRPQPQQRRQGGRVRQDPVDGIDEVCRPALASLRRRDQREKGLAYVRGLLRARGRMSVRNITGPGADQAAMQSLHHFINDSPWDWNPVREALAARLDQLAPVRLWAVRPLVTHRSGRHIVGVGEYAPDGWERTVHAQRSTGVWAVSEEARAPVHWRLRLEGDWLEDRDRRRRAAVPDSVVAESPERHLFHACRKAARWGLRPRPFLVDARGLEPAPLLGHFDAAGLPLLARIAADQPLLAERPWSRHGAVRACTAGEVLCGARRLQPTAVGPRGEVRLAAGVPVSLPGQRRGPQGGTVLLGEWLPGGSAPSRFWLTNLATPAPTVLLRLCALADRGWQDADRLARSVGVGAYEGRSFNGWHRHTTLASTAHAVAALERGAEAGGEALLGQAC